MTFFLKNYIFEILKTNLHMFSKVFESLNKIQRETLRVLFLLHQNKIKKN